MTRRFLFCCWVLTGCSFVDDVDGDGFSVNDGDCDDADTNIFPGQLCPCPAGFYDCDNTGSCDTPAASVPGNCCNPKDEFGNSLSDCDGDGYCECYGACGSAPDYECLGE